MPMNNICAFKQLTKTNKVRIHLNSIHFIPLVPYLIQMQTNAEILNKNNDTSIHIEKNINIKL